MHNNDVHASFWGMARDANNAKGKMFEVKGTPQEKKHWNKGDDSELKEKHECTTLRGNTAQRYSTASPEKHQPKKSLRSRRRANAPSRGLGLCPS